MFCLSVTTEFSRRYIDFKIFTTFQFTRIIKYILYSKLILIFASIRPLRLTITFITFLLSFSFLNSQLGLHSSHAHIHIHCHSLACSYSHLYIRMDSALKLITILKFALSFGLTIKLKTYSLTFATILARIFLLLSLGLARKLILILIDIRDHIRRYFRMSHSHSPLNSPLKRNIRIYLPTLIFAITFSLGSAIAQMLIHNAHTLSFSFLYSPWGLPQAHVHIHIQNHP